jgi:hypothetical protein
MTRRAHVEVRSRRSPRLWRHLTMRTAAVQTRNAHPSPERPAHVRSRAATSSVGHLGGVQLLSHHRLHRIPPQRHNRTSMGLRRRRRRRIGLHNLLLWQLDVQFQNQLRAGVGLQRPGIKGKNGPCAVLTCEALLSTFSSLQLSRNEVSGWDIRSLKLTVPEWRDEPWSR